METRQLIPNDCSIVATVKVINDSAVDGLLDTMRGAVKQILDAMERRGDEARLVTISVLPGNEDVSQRLTALNNAMSVVVKDNDLLVLRTPPYYDGEESMRLAEFVRQRLKAQGVTLLVLPSGTDLDGVDPESALGRVMIHNHQQHQTIVAMQNDVVQMRTRIVELEAALAAKMNGTMN